MDLTKQLYNSIIPDAKEHPEKLNATSERVQEVLDSVLGDDTMDVSKALASLGEETEKEYQALNEYQAEIIVEAVLKQTDISQLKQIIQMLENSEISTAEAVSLHETYKIPVSKLEKDIIPVKGEGSWLIGNDGKKFLDMDSNYSATNLGMSNPEIAQALYNQASQLISMKEDRVHIARARFLKTFKGMLPDELSYFYWQNSGGEAVDKSLKIAKAYTKQTGVVAFKGGFHGRTHGAVAVTYNEKYRKPFGLDKLDWVHFVDYNDAEAVEQLFKSGKAKVIILELVQGEEAGIMPAKPDFVKKLREICDTYNGALICDEVQTGFGRVAEKEGNWFACQNYDIVPDIIVIGKSFGGGYPVTAVVTKKEISDAMVPGYDGSTFGGNPMAMVSAMIATNQMKKLGITKNVVHRSDQIKQGLYSLKEKYSIIDEIRIKGLFIGIGFPTKEHVSELQELLKQQGIKSSLSTGNTIRFLPPLIITEKEIQHLLCVLDACIAKLQDTLQNAA